MSEDNPFVAIGTRQLVSPVKAKLARREKREYKRDSEAPMVPGAADKNMLERNEMARRHRVWRAGEEQKLLDGPHGGGVRALKEFLHGMKLDDAPVLIATVEGAAWLRTADKETQSIVISMIGTAIMRLRERNGLTPFDDPLPGEPSNAFLKILELLK